MNRYLIEVPHAEDKQSCALAIKAFLETGAHFMTNADWGCSDGEHKAWFVIELESKEEARTILPPAFRKDAKIVSLQKFTMAEIDAVLAQHEMKPQ